MAAAFALELCWSLFLVPDWTVEVRDEGVKPFADEGAGGDGPVAPLRSAILAMPFV